MIFPFFFYSSLLETCLRKWRLCNNSRMCILLKKTKRKNAQKIVKMAELNTTVWPTRLVQNKTQKKKYAAACPTRLCSSLWIVNSKQIIQKGNKLPKLDFLEVWSFFGGYIKVLQCAIFCKLNKPPLHYSSTDRKKSPERIFKKKWPNECDGKKTLFFPDFLFCLSSIIFMFMFRISYIDHYLKKSNSQ